MSLKLPRTENFREVSSWRKNISTDSIVLSKNASNFKHAVTTHKRVYGAALADSTGEAAPANKTKYYAEPAAADSADDFFYIPVIDIPEGGIITQVDLYGYTAASTSNIILLTLLRSKFDEISSSTVATVSITNAETSNSTTTITNGTIDSDYRYVIYVAIRATGAVSDSRYRQAKITFTTANLGQI